MVAHVSDFQIQVGCEGVLNIQSPGRHVRSCDIAIDPHDGTRTRPVRIAIDSRAAEIAIERRSAVPLRGKWWNRQITRRDRASSGDGIGCAGSRYDRSRGNAGQAEAIVEGQERFPVYGFECHAAATTEHRFPLTINVPRKTRRVERNSWDRCYTPFRSACPPARFRGWDQSCPADCWNPITTEANS